MRVLDLFSGIGGFSLGLERAGMQTVAFCEIEPYCRAVLRKHWPDVPIFEDVRTLTAADVPGVDVICGGFPCQDISNAGSQAGITGKRSGLWKEYHRLIGEIRPKFIIVENVAALLGRGLSTVLGDLSEIGFDAQWHIISASDVGAPHQRERVWIVAYPKCNGFSVNAAGSITGRMGCGESQASGIGESEAIFVSGSCEGVSNSNPAQSAGMGNQGNSREIEIPDAYSQGLERQRKITGRIESQLRNLGDNRWWESEPSLGRVANGVPNRVDRIKALGNAVVPQIPEIIGRAIMQAEGLA